MKEFNEYEFKDFVAEQIANEDSQETYLKNIENNTNYYQENVEELSAWRLICFLGEYLKAIGENIGGDNGN